MAKFYGKIGYETTEEVRPSVYKPIVKERNYYGDVLRNSRRLEGHQINDNVNISNTISIVADPYAWQNFHAMRYVVWMGSKWKITNVEEAYPRLNLTLGGVYNGTNGPST